MSFVKIGVLVGIASLCLASLTVQQASATSGTGPDCGNHVASVERGLNLDELMRENHVPGMSVAVIDNFKIVCAKGYGVTELGGCAYVTPHTVFLAGSISKPVAAVGALNLVERGKLSLDADVNTELITWKVPENDYTRLSWLRGW